MLNLPANIRIYVCVAPCDMRKQFDGLAGLVTQGMDRDPRSGDMFVFRNKRADMTKVLFFDRQGYCLLAKRMDRDTFKFGKQDDAGPLEITSVDLATLLRGLPIKRP